MISAKRNDTKYNFKNILGEDNNNLIKYYILYIKIDRNIYKSILMENKNLDEYILANKDSILRQDSPYNRVF